jgi:hypothetical protein
MRLTRAVIGFGLFALASLASMNGCGGNGANVQGYCWIGSSQCYEESVAWCNARKGSWTPIGSCSDSSDSGGLTGTDSDGSASSSVQTARSAAR